MALGRSLFIALAIHAGVALAGRRWVPGPDVVLPPAPPASYEVNVVDHNALVGPVADVGNLHVACGFSGHGMQHAPAVGRALAQRIATGHYADLDLAPLAAERLQRGEPLIEHNVI